MRTSYKFFAGVAAAGLVIASGSAYTAANTVPANTGAGYGSTTATGVTVATMTVNPAANPINLGSVVYTVASDVSSMDFVLSNNGVVVTAACGASYSNPTTTITCTPDSTTTIASITSFGLTATN